MNRGETMYKIVGASWRLQWGSQLAQQLQSLPTPSGVHGGRLVCVAKRQRVLPSVEVVERAVWPKVS